MIINLKGPSGAGKSTIVREIMEYYEDKKPMFIEGRKQPIGYTFKRPRSSYMKSPLMVVGHYEIPCGGADTIKFKKDVFDMIRKFHKKKYDVMFEGLLISVDALDTIQLHKDGFPLLVIGLDTSLEECLKRIYKRRKAKKPGEPVKERESTVKNATNKYKGVRGVMKRLEAAGVRAVWKDCDAAVDLIKQELGLPLEV